MKNRQGFTLIELLMSIGLLTVLLGVLTNLLLTTIDVQLRASSLSQIEQDARYLALRLKYDLHRASAITIPSLNGQNGAIAEILIDGSTYTFSIQNGMFTRTSPGGTDQLTSVGTTVSNFSVTRVGNTNGGDTLRFQYTLTSGTQTQEYQTSTGLR